jgi:IS30 family transposase
MEREAQMKNRIYKRLTLTERREIEHGLGIGQSLNTIAKSIQRGTSTVSREIQRNSYVKQSGAARKPFNNCANRNTCNEHDICTNDECRRPYCTGCIYCIHVCKKYVRENCPALFAPPYVCNACKRKVDCTLEKFFYSAPRANRIALGILTESRSGVSLDESERKRISDIVTPLVRQGQSPYHICLTNKDALMISDKTLYKYIAAGLMEAQSTDLLRKVKMRPRKKKPVVKIERACMQGRTYRDFLEYMDEYPDTEVVQMDTVIGKAGGGEKCLLTICFPKSELMLAYIRDANTARSVTEVFERLKTDLDYNLFEEIFPLILTDRGSEFSAPTAIEFDEDSGLCWTPVFYCDPNCAYQKPEVESGHRLIRRVLSKGTSLNRFTQDDIDLMMSHVNSYRRRSLAGKSPTQVFAGLHGNKIIRLLGLSLIPSNEITLKPSLLK